MRADPQPRRRAVGAAGAGGARLTPVIIVGEAHHPEVEGTAGWAKGPVFYAATPEEAEALPPMDRAAVVAQTTFPQERWEAVLEILRRRVKSLSEHCTICSATHTRQTEARDLAGQVDVAALLLAQDREREVHDHGDQAGRRAGGLPGPPGKTFFRVSAKKSEKALPFFPWMG